MRLSDKEAQDLILGTATTITYELKGAQVEAAEDTLDWTVWKLLDHGYFSAAFDLIDTYKDKRSKILYGEDS